jgi:hypothetical protein
MTAEPILQQPCEQRVGVGPDSALFLRQAEKGAKTFRTKILRLYCVPYYPLPYTKVAWATLVALDRSRGRVEDADLVVLGRL